MTALYLKARLVRVELVELGVVAAPSGVLVLATVGHLDYIWPSIGERLSDRAAAVAATGGGHFQERLFEAVAVPVDADRRLPVLAATQPSPFFGETVITMLEVRLGGEGAGRLLGDLPADRCGMVLGDAVALDSWAGPSTEPGTGYDTFAGCLPTTRCTSDRSRLPAAPSSASAGTRVTTRCGIGGSGRRVTSTR